MKELGVEIIKVGSAQVTHLNLIEEVASYNLPVIMSTGMSTIEEIDTAVEIFKTNKTDLTLMHCTSCYPCSYENINLRIIPILKERYKVPVGFSGHYSSVGIDAAAVAIGATCIERHFTLDRTMKGTDHSSSLEPAGMEKVIKYIRATEQAMGSCKKRILDCEMPARLKFCGQILS